VQAKGARIVHQCEGGRQLLARREGRLSEPPGHGMRRPIPRDGERALLGQNVFVRRCIPTLYVSVVRPTATMALTRCAIDAVHTLLGF
jgi:hypothetical protein